MHAYLYAWGHECMRICVHGDLNACVSVCVGICVSEKTAFYQHAWTSVYSQLIRRKIEELNVRLPEDGADVRRKAYENVK